MLNKYVKINGERVPNPIDYSESFSKVSNTFQSEAGDDLAIDVRAGKYSGSLKFQVSSRWKNKMLGYAKMQSVKLQIDEAEYTVRIESIDCDRNIARTHKGIGRYLSARKSYKARRR